jgi:hypothetical protein
MRLWAIVLTLLGTIVGSSEATAITTYSSSMLQDIIVTATVPDRNDTPLYFLAAFGIRMVEQPVQLTSSHDLCGIMATSYDRIQFGNPVAVHAFAADVYC